MLFEQSFLFTEVQLKYLHATSTVCYIDIAVIYSNIVGRFFNDSMCYNFVCILIDYHNSVRAVCQINVVVVNEASVAESLPLIIFILWIWHLIVPLLVAIHVINIETGSSKTSIDLIIFNGNYILTIIRLDAYIGRECLGIFEILTLLIDDFDGRRDSHLGIFVSFIQIKTHNFPLPIATCLAFPGLLYVFTSFMVVASYTV